MAREKSSASAHPSTRHHRCDERFLEILEEDFGIALWELRHAFLGVPPAPKKQALAVCCWAESKSDDPEERGRMIRAWAKRRKVGMYDPRMHDQEPQTFGGRPARGV